MPIITLNCKLNKIHVVEIIFHIDKKVNLFFLRQFFEKGKFFLPFCISDRIKSLLILWKAWMQPNMKILFWRVFSGCLQWILISGCDAYILNYLIKKLEFQSDSRFKIEAFTFKWTSFKKNHKFRLFLRCFACSMFRNKIIYYTIYMNMVSMIQQFNFWF